MLFIPLYFCNIAELCNKIESHITSVQYCESCSVHWRLFSTSDRGITSVLWGCFSTVEVAQYCGDTFSTVEVVQYSGDNISKEEGIQYCGLIP